MILLIAAKKSSMIFISSSMVTFSFCSVLFNGCLRNGGLADEVQEIVDDFFQEFKEGEDILVNNFPSFAHCNSPPAV